MHLPSSAVGICVRTGRLPVLEVRQPETEMSEVTSYTELIGAIRAQIGVMGVKYADFDVLAWFAPGLSGKVFGPAQVKRLGPEKLFDALRASGLRLRVEVDPEQLAKMQAMIEKQLIEPRQANQARPNNNASPVSSKLMGRVFKHFSRLGVKARMRKMTKAQREAHARHAANQRWKRYRKQRKAAHIRRQRQKAKADTAPPIHP